MFSTPLVSLLTGVFNGAFHEGSLPRPILDISIPILPKKEKKRPHLWSSYMLIRLLKAVVIILAILSGCQQQLMLA